MSLVPLIALLIDIILTLNTAFYDKGVLIDDKALILSNYMTEYFFLDLITISPMLITVFGN